MGLLRKKQCRCESRLRHTGQMGTLAKSVCRGAISLYQIWGHFYTSKYSTYVQYLCLDPDFLKRKLIYGIT